MVEYVEEMADHARPADMASVSTLTRQSDHGTYVGDPVVDYVKAPQMAETLIETGASKKDLTAGQIFVRGVLGGGLLAFPTSMAFFAVAQHIPPIIAARLFPFGFICINLLQVDLLTGYFALVPVAVLHKRMTFAQLLRVWFWVWLGNLAGSTLYALLLWSALTLNGATADTTGIAKVLITVAGAKSIHYEQFGMAGALAALVKGILCNWMVTLGVVLPYHARSVVGKAIATFVPIYMFFSMQWEHLVVNMFIFPAAMLFGGHISMYDWWVVNEIPVTIGNFVGGFLSPALQSVFSTRVNRLSSRLRCSRDPMRRNIRLPISASFPRERESVAASPRLAPGPPHSRG